MSNHIIKMKVPSHKTIDRRILKMCEIIVHRIEEHPERNYIRNALTHVRECKLKRGSYRYYNEWEKILQLPFENIKRVLLSPNEGCNRLRHTLPFRNILTEKERIGLVLKSYGRKLSDVDGMIEKIREFEEQEGL